MHNRLKYAKEMLMAQVESQLSNLKEVDTEELGDVIDMIKDLEEAIYYCTITKAMEKKDEENASPQSYNINYYTEPYYDRMYYGENNMAHWGNENGSMRVQEGKEGRSPHVRKTYMEHKKMNMDKNVKMRDLENYINELTKDIVEMIEDASPEEKQLLQQKIAVLSQKIV